MSSDRPVRFELHILPMFRLLDRDHMAFAFDLHDPATFYDDEGKPRMRFIEELAEYVAGDHASMPTRGTGGPWPKEWQALFRRWIDEGCLRLTVASGKFKAVRRPEGTVKLNGLVQGIGADAQAWFQRVADRGGTRAFVPYIEPGEQTSGAVLFPTEDINGLTSDTVWVLAADGEFEIAIQ